MTNQKSKRAISFMLVLAMLMTLLVGTTAWFTDRVSTSASGTAGTVTIDLDDSGINLKDSAGKDILNPGDLRNVSYKVSNTGNKSVDVKETIYLTAYDKLGQALNLSDTQSEFEIYAATDVKFIDNRGYVPNDGAEPLQVKTLNGNVITYEIPVYALNGSTNFDDDNREIEDDISSDFKTSEYVLVFKGTSGNKFQASVLKLDLVVEAKQHRNTENVLWSEVATSTHILSNGNTVYIVDGAGVVINPSEDFEAEDLGNGNIKITGLTETGANKETLVIPSTIVDSETGKSYTVTDIDWKEVFADSNNTTINNSAVGLPQPSDNLVFEMTGNTITGLTENGNKLTEVSIPEQVNGTDTELSDEMVEEIVNSDANISIPDSVMENLPATALYTYSINESSNEATIMGLTEMGKMAQTLDIPSEINGATVTTIAEESLLDTKATEVIIPSTITTATKAFAGWNINSGRNYSIKTVTLNNSVISPSMFAGAEALETVNITSGVTSIGRAAFQGCISLKNITLNEGITEIGNIAFLDCTSLTSITLPSSLTTIGSNTFENTGLTSIVIPSNVTSIGAEAFKNCDSLTSYTLENNVIGEKMFDDCDGLTSVIVPSNITSVGYGAFQNCSNVTSYTLENSVMGRMQFANCDALTEVTIPANITTDNEDYYGHNGAFSGCDGLTTVNFETGATIGGYMFENCTSLNNVVIPEGVTIVNNQYGAYTFQNCTGLTNVTINSAGLVNQMFAGCTNLETVILGDNVTIIKDRVFNGCSSLKEITIPSTVTEIAATAFNGLDGITIHYAGGLTGFPWGATNATLVAD